MTLSSPSHACCQIVFKVDELDAVEADRIITRPAKIRLKRVREYKNT